MINPDPNQQPELETILQKAEEFHGHMGPFLVLGVRMSLAGLRELGVKETAERIQVTIMTRPYTPFSCVIDGVQVATHCTVGNKKLKLRSAQDISARFKAHNGKRVTISINPSKLDELTKSLTNNCLPEEVEKLAEIIASTPEEELLTVKR